jgi:dihydrofolate reductase
MSITCSVFIAVSLDGFIARPNGEIDWLTENRDQNSGEDYGYQEFYKSIDTLVMGSNTYELVLTFPEWPYTDKKVIILSSRLQTVPEGLAGKVEFYAGSPAKVMSYLTRIGAKHVYVDGGKTIQAFLKAGYIHEITITRLPFLMGEGIPLFGPLGHDIRLQHIETVVYPNGYIQSSYRVCNSGNRSI